MKLDKLEELELDNENDINEQFLASAKFKLNSLNVYVEDRVRNYNRFLRAQPDLKRLYICFGDQLIGEIGSYVDAILNLRKLENLDIFFADESGDEELDLGIDAPANLSIQSFSLGYQIERLLLFKKKDAQLLNNLRMFEKICIKTTTKDCILAELNLPNLLEVSIRFEEPDYRHAHVIDSEEFIKFLKNHPKLEKLKIDGPRGINIEREVWEYLGKF